MARQKRIIINDKYYFIDFYNRLLRCSVIIEKMMSLNYEDLGQLNAYMGYCIST